MLNSNSNVPIIVYIIQYVNIIIYKYLVTSYMMTYDVMRTNRKKK